MHRLRFCAALGFCLMANLPIALAHHTAGHGGGGSSFYNPFSTQSRPPRSFVSFTFNADILDDDLGEVYLYQVSGEYAVTRRFSMGVRIPFWSIQEKFLPGTNSIGDLGLTFKGLLWRHPAHRQNLTLGMSTTFPTGSESEGTGAGAVTFSPFLNYTLGLGRVDFYLTLGNTTAAASDPSPSFDFNTGFNIPVLKGKLPVHLFLGFQGSTTLADDVFTNGSTKAYLAPGVILYLKNNLITTFGARVSVMDTLRVKPGVALSKLSPALLSDVKVGANFNVDYFF
jgi:hypothetical protein